MRIFFTLLLAVCFAAAGWGQVSINALNTPYTDNFTGFLGAADPANWTTSNVGADASTWQGINAGAGTTGGKYSYGTGAGATFEGSLGFLPSGSRSINADISFTNNTGVLVEELTVSYTAEHWRSTLGGRNNGWAVSYAIGAGPFVPLNDLTFVAVNTFATGAGPGGAPWATAALSQTVTGLSIPKGATVTIRFFGDNGSLSGSRQGVAIDDFSFKMDGCSTLPDVPTLSITDNVCPSISGIISANGCGAGTVLEYATDAAGPWSSTPPAYTSVAFTVYARCRNTTTDCVSNNAVATTAPTICGLANDLCANAIPIACGQTVSGTNIGATDTGQPEGHCNFVYADAPGVWYAIVGTGDIITLSTCSPNTNFDTQLFVFSGACGNLVCVNANDDVFESPCSTVGFVAQEGVTYYILVNSFSGEGEGEGEGENEGNFELSANCTPLPGCGDTWYDFGGPNGNYFNNDNTVYTFCPDQPGGAVTVTFTQFDTEEDFDFMRVFDGDNTAAPALHTGDGFTGATIPGPFTSTHPSGCLTFNFISDFTVSRSGWAADITCSVPACEVDLSCPPAVIANTDPGLCQWTSPAGSLAPALMSQGCSAVELSWEIEFPANAPTPAVTVAEWNFENAAKRVAPNLPYTADAGTAANVNTAPLSLAGGPVFTAWVAGSGGGGTFAPNSNMWTAAGDKYWQTVLNTTGYANLLLSSRQQSSNTGPRNFQVEYSLNGSTWTAVPGAAIVVANNFNSGVLTNIALPAACNNQPTLYLRWLQVGTTAVNGSPVAGAGTNRIDDIRITGAAPVSGSGTAAGAAFPVGTSTVTYTATGDGGEPETCSFTVTVNDNQPPVITCPGAQVVALGSNCTAVVPDYRVPGTASDNCGIQALTQTPAPGSIVSGAGMFTVTLTAEDPSGNTATCSINVTKVDFTPPTVQCFNPTLTFNGENTIPLNANNLVSATDNCGVATITLSPTGISCEQVGQTVPVTVTVTDVNNLTSTCTSNVTVAGLPCGWSQNPNGVGCNSSISYNPATGEWGVTAINCYYANPFTIDAFAFAQRTLCGDGSITAQVTDISGTSLGWAGLMMRESNDAGAKKAQLMTNLSNLSRREFRVNTNGSAYPQQFPSNTRYWLRLVRAGSQFSMYVSANGLAWYFVGAQTIQMNACIQVGLVTTNYQQNSTVTATFANVGFTGSNVPPMVELGIGHAGRGEGIEAPHSFEAYPNPTSGELNVDLAQYVGRTVRLELYSLTGQLLRFAEIDEVQTTLERLDLSAFQSGMYLVKVKSDGLPDATRRIVVTR
jgi:hypothetical protein